MKAAICKKYGPPENIHIVEVPKPKPQKNEVLIKIRATAVTASDIYIRSAQIPLRLQIPMRLMLGITGPRKKIIGLVFAGEIEDVGENCSRFSIGTKVYGISGFSLGAYAEYICINENDSIKGCIALMPENLSFESATAAAYGGLLGFQYLEKTNIQKGQHILIYGASGTSGTMAVQYAKYLGATVTAVCSEKNEALVKHLGADFTIDYTKQKSIAENIQFDAILDSVGKSKTSDLKKSCKQHLKQGGTYATIDDGALKLDSKRLNTVTSCIENNFIKPIVDRIYNFSELVEAHKYVEKGHKVGGVAITVQ